MIKIAALNDESQEESASEEEVTKEALEQIAQQQYAKALELQRKGNLPDATQLLKDLLDTELLYDVNKPEPGEKNTGPLLNLKYLCYKNLASMLSTSEDYEGAINAYYSASELDDTDLTLWYRLGLVCIRAKQYEKALDAFETALDCNQKHWPSLDKIITLLLGLNCTEQCIEYIHKALNLDPDYLRGLVYRRHIYSVYHHMREYMEHQNPIYKWNESEDSPIDEEKAEKLLKEADEINKIYIQEVKEQDFKTFIPILKLKKPISSFSWDAVGESLVHMHHFITENSYSHACPLELIFEQEEPMEVCEETIKPPENKPDEPATEPNTENNSENENNDLSDKDKAATDNEKVESDMEVVPSEASTDTTQDSKTQKKNPVRRRGSALRNLQMWEWCTRKSGRKKQEVRTDDNIYDVLRRMIPVHLSPEIIERKENQERATSPDVTDVNKLFIEDNNTDVHVKYFGTDTEQDDVKEYINKYTKNKADIIDMLHEFLNTLAQKWQYEWPEGLSSKFIEANKCYNNHVDIPNHTDDDLDALTYYIKVHILAEEFLVNDLLNKHLEDKEPHDMSLIETINIILTMRPQVFSGVDALQITLRSLWVQLHIHILDKNNAFALDCLYQLINEFEAMGEHKEEYRLKVVNFTFKPIIAYHVITTYVKFLERKKKLATVLDLYEKEEYEEVLSIVIDSVEYYKTIAKEQENDMSLDFAAQLSLILDTYWAMGNTEECFKWSFTCLHEALKHYFRYTSGSVDYEQWTQTVVKILSCMEHIIKVEGLTCLDSISTKDLSQGLEDLIRIIGHQVETNVSEMPFGTVSPWIIMHYILQKQEDLGKGRTNVDPDNPNEDISNPFMVLFVAHEHLGNRSWCMHSSAKLLNFTLEVVAPFLRSPALAKCLEQVTQHMEQCVFCLFGHPGKKTKLKYLQDHSAKPQSLDWQRAQYVYEVFRPSTLPVLVGKVPGITTDTEQLFHRILDLLPQDMDPQKYLSDIEKYIKGSTELLPVHSTLLPHKMRDIYFLMGDYHFKREEHRLAIKYNMLDIVVNNDRLESWAQISLAKALNLENLLNSCKNINNEKEYLTPAKSVIRCHMRALELDPSHCSLRIEYGMFVYTVHSFCSRVLKQASESLSMEDFASLEKQKEDMLDTTQKCFATILKDHNDIDKDNEDSWLQFYMLGKVAEKRNEEPSVYLDYYLQAVKCLQETDATYPLKINYSSPAHLCFEVLELHYRIHASILKYIEQHENKPIPASVGKVFAVSIRNWKNSLFSKKNRKDNNEGESETKANDSVHAANILKRSISDAGEEETTEAKRQKLESAAAKVRRSASYDTERIANNKDPISSQNKIDETDEQPQQEKVVVASSSTSEDNTANTLVKVVSFEVSDKMDVDCPKDSTLNENKDEAQTPSNKKIEQESEKKCTSSSSSSSSSSTSSSESSTDSSSDSSRDSNVNQKTNPSKTLTDTEIMEIVGDCLDALEDCASRFTPHYKAIYRLAHYHYYYKKGKNIERCRDLLLSMYSSRSGQKQAGLFSERKNSNFFNNIWKIPITEVDRGGGFAFHMNRATLLTMEILKEFDDHKTLLDLSLYLQKVPEPGKTYLRDCDREELAQQAFSLCVHSLKGQLMKFSQQADLKSNEVERQALKSLMLDIYRAYHRAQTQKQPNSKQFTNLLVDAYKLITTAPITESMNLVDISLKYCHSVIQALKQQATQASLDKSQNIQRKQTFKSTEVPKTTSTAMVTNTMQSKPDTSKTDKPPTSSSNANFLAPVPKLPQQDLTSTIQNLIPFLNDPQTSQQTAAALSYMNNLTAIANYTSSIQASLQNTMPNPLQNSFQAEFYRQFFNQAISALILPPKKQKRATKTSSTYKAHPMNTAKSSSQTASLTKPFVSTSITKSSSYMSQPKPSSSHVKPPVSHSTSKSVAHGVIIKPATSYTQPKTSVSLSNLPSSQHKATKSFASTTVTKATPTPVITSLQKSASAPLALGTVLPTLPPSLSNLSTFGSSHSSAHSAPQAHMSTSSTVSAAIHSKPPMPHQQVSPGKTLQEKLAERQKNMPTPKGSHEFNALSRLPSSLMITKTSNKPGNKKPDAKKSLSFGDKERPKPITSDEVIILDDD